MDIIREDPPSKTGLYRYNWPVMLAPLLKDPGVWYKIRKMKRPASANGVAYSVKRGTLKSLPTGKWDACARGVFVYVRYIGGENEGAD